MINVNEEALRQIMASDKQSYLTSGITTPVEEKEPEMPGETIVFSEPPASEPERQENPVSASASVPVSNTDTGKVQKKRKGQKGDFSELFLKERIVKNKKQIYISAETHDVIRSYLKYIGDVSFIAYVDNILLQHIEEHKDTINDLFEKKTKPF
jgi:hypothetical protein